MELIDNYLKSVGKTEKQLGDVRPQPFSILCVCNSNFNRSPAVEMVFDYLINKSELTDSFLVESGAVRDVVPEGWGNRNVELAKAFEQQFGVLPKSIANKSLTPEQVLRADEIIVANESVKAALIKRFPEQARGKEIVSLEKEIEKAGITSGEGFVGEGKKLFEIRQVVERALWPEVMEKFFRRIAAEPNIRLSQGQKQNLEAVYQKNLDKILPVDWYFAPNWVPFAQHRVDWKKVLDSVPSFPLPRDYFDMRQYDMMFDVIIIDPISVFDEGVVSEYSEYPGNKWGCEKGTSPLKKFLNRADVQEEYKKRLRALNVLASRFGIERIDISLGDRQRSFQEEDAIIDLGHMHETLLNLIGQLVFLSVEKKMEQLGEPLGIPGIINKKDRDRLYEHIIAVRQRKMEEFQEMLDRNMMHHIIPQVLENTTDASPVPEQPLTQDQMVLLQAI